MERYEKEKMPTRYSTRKSYEVWLRKHILPKWGEHSIVDPPASPRRAVARQPSSGSKEP